jgi:hypothetical protein
MRQPQAPSSLRVRLRRALAHPLGTGGEGRVIEVPEAFGHRLIAEGNADLAPPRRPPAAVTAAAAPAPASNAAPAAAVADIVALKAREAVALVAAAKSIEQLDALQAAEEGNAKHDGGRVSVLHALDARRAEISGEAGE